jgi:hypothetical protein
VSQPVHPPPPLSTRLPPEPLQSASLRGIRQAELLSGDYDHPAVESRRSHLGRAVFAGSTRDLLDEGVSLLLGLLGKRLSPLKDLVDERLSLLKGLI